MSFQWWGKRNKNKGKQKSHLTGPLKNCDSEKEMLNPHPKAAHLTWRQESDLAFEAASKIPPHSQILTFLTSYFIALMVNLLRSPLNAAGICH